MIALSPYLINGQPAEGSAFRSAVEALRPEDYDNIEFSRTDKCKLSFLTHVDGETLMMLLTRPDGSEWTAPGSLTKSEADQRTERFLADDPAWDEGVRWELFGLATAESRRRIAWLLIIAALVAGMVQWGLPALLNH